MNGTRHPLARFMAAARRRVRLRRAIAGGLVGVGAICVAALAPAAVALLGFGAPWWWGPATLAALVTLAFMVGAAVVAGVGVRDAVVAAEADRRLVLDGALITALEVMQSSDSIGRLLVERTAAAVARSRSRQAIPLRLPAVAILVPALATVAFAVSTQTPAARSARPSAPVEGELVSVALSTELQSAVSRLLAIEGLSDEALDAARRVLELDEALRLGSMTEEQVRRAVAELAAALDRQPEPASEGRDPGPGRSDDTGSSETAARRILEEVAIVPAADGAVSAMTVAGVAGPGAAEQDEAGSGRAALETARAEAVEVGPSESARIWSLPGAGHTRRAEGGPRFAPDDPRSDSTEIDPRGSRLVRPARPLTTIERSVVDRYLDLLDRERDRKTPDDSRRRESADEQQESPS